MTIARSKDALIVYEIMDDGSLFSEVRLYDYRP